MTMEHIDTLILNLPANLTVSSGSMNIVSFQPRSLRETSSAVLLVLHTPISKINTVCYDKSNVTK